MLIGKSEQRDMDNLPLERRHRDVMLDLILAWGTLDGALGILLSTAGGLALDRGAEKFGRSGNPAKLKKLCGWLRELPGGANAASKLEKHVSLYEKYAEARNAVAHAKCLGVAKDDSEYVVFLKFEKHVDGELLCLKIPLREMREATRWAEALSDAALKMEALWRPLLSRILSREN